MKRVLIVGAASAIAEATARLFAARGDSLYLVARNAVKLEDLAADLRVRGSPRVDSMALDMNDTATHAVMLDRAEAALGGIDIVLVAHGTLSDQAACEQSVALTLSEISTNALSTIALLTLVANRLERAGSGAIAVISSVAGDRGRRSNYVYGCAKAMVSAFLSGLRQRLGKANVGVVTVKPGFVDTPMTQAFRKNFLWAQPGAIAQGIVRALDRNAAVVYLPFFWTFIMLIIKCVPERIFRKLTL